MLYLTLDDLHMLIKEDVLARIASPEQIDEAERFVMLEVEAFLSNRYDMGAVWSNTQERNHLLVMLMVDLVLYHLHCRLNPQAVPEIRQFRYEQALDTLKNLSTGRLSIRLPVPADTPKPCHIFIGSEKRRDL